MSIDIFSYRLGAADCFCEMVRAGVKKFALSHPCDSETERDEFLPEFKKLCEKYNVKMYVEDDPLLTDLFPVSMNKGKHNVIFYREDDVINAYLALKEEKKNAVADGIYDKVREEIAVKYGHILSYPDEGIKRLMAENKEKEGM